MSYTPCEGRINFRSVCLGVCPLVQMEVRCRPERKPQQGLPRQTEFILSGTSGSVLGVGRVFIAFGYRRFHRATSTMV